VFRWPLLSACWVRKRERLPRPALDASLAGAKQFPELLAVGTCLGQVEAVGERAGDEVGKLDEGCTGAVREGVLAIVKQAGEAVGIGVRAEAVREIRAPDLARDDAEILSAFGEPLVEHSIDVFVETAFEAQTGVFGDAVLIDHQGVVAEWQVLEGFEEFDPALVVGADALAGNFGVATQVLAQFAAGGFCGGESLVTIIGVNALNRSRCRCCRGPQQNPPALTNLSRTLALAASLDSQVYVITP